MQHLKELALLESRKMQKKLYQIVKDSRLDEESFFRRSSALYDKIMQSRHDADMRPDDPEGYERLRRSITDSIGSTAVEIVLSCAHRIEKALAKLLRCAPGIGYWIDMELATDDLVFAILGPNSGSYGNKEVALTFSDTTMYHPDFFVTPGAAMNWYRSAYTYKKCIKLDRTAWLGPSLPWGKGGEVAFDLDKFAPAASPGWAAAFAMEWIARISTKKFIPPEAVTLRSVAEYYATSSQYTTLEAHLPGFLPFVYVDSVCVSEKALRGAPPFILDYVLKINSIRPGFVSVVPDVTKHIEEVTCGSRALMECVKRAHSKECCPQQPQAQPRGNGFSFVVVPGLEECFVPVLITALPCRVSFSVVSKFSDFLITLSDAPVFHAHPSRPALSESGEEHPDPLHELKKRKKKYLREPDVAENVYISRNYDGPQRSDVLTFRIGRDRSAAALPCGAKMAYAPSDRSPPLAACENFVIGTKSDFVFTASEGVVCLTNTSNDKTISVEPYRCTSKHMFLSFSSFAAEPIVSSRCTLAHFFF